MFILQLLSLLPLAFGTVLPREDDVVSYDGHKAYRINTDNDVEDVLSKLSSLTHDQWNCRVTDHVDISLPASEVEKFKSMGFDYKLMHEDLGADITAESAPSSSGFTIAQIGALPNDKWFDSYHPYADHVQYWKNLNTAFSNNSEYFVAGKSFENRDIFGLKLFGNDTSITKPAIIWHGTVHAREWITNMAIEYITYSLIKNYQSNTDPSLTSILDTYDLYILPIVNPDGFIYTQTRDRLWRKNRQPAPSLIGSLKLCYGTDINRNWPYQWLGDPQGASPNPCDQTYRGESAGNTPENKALVAQMTSVAEKQPIAQYIDFHSYGQYILSPYGYTADVPENSDEQVQLGNEAAEAIRGVYGTNFTVGPSGATLYPTTGSSADFASDVAGAEYAYAFELRDTGENGFVLPPEQIREVGEEMLEGVKVMVLGM